MLVTLEAPAKLTLSLDVVGVRDDGYHLIDAEMVSLDWGDLLEVTTGDDLVVVTAGVERAGSQDDLVARALQACGRRAAVRLHKVVPPGAGLGGGSSDAAAIMRWAGELDPQVAVRLGADVPFCVRGGRARVTGVSERVEPLPFQPQVLTLFTPPLHCSTPRVYAAWDELGGPRGDHGNDLEPAALVAYPQLAVWRDRFAERTGRRPRLAGSGATWFVEGEHPGPDHLVVRTRQPHEECGQRT